MKPIFAIFAALFVWFWVCPTWASERWYLELKETDVDESVVRRTVALELREVEIPARVDGCSGANGSTRDSGENEVSLYVRVVSEDKKLVVSLWDRGEYVGRRVISNTGHASVKARRVGLAVAELARQLEDDRKRTIRQHARDQELEGERALQLREKKNREALALRSGVDALWITEGAWLVGPHVGLDFNGYFPLRFSTRFGWLAGELPVLSDASLEGSAPGFSQFDFSFGLAFQHAVSKRTQLSLGAILAVSAVHVNGSTEVDGISGQRDTWSSRLGARIGASRQIYGQVWGHLDLTAGTVLRSIPMTRGEATFSVGGAFLGGSLAVSVAP